jgi:hypothetical protein
MGIYIEVVRDQSMASDRVSDTAKEGNQAQAQAKPEEPSNAHLLDQKPFGEVKIAAAQTAVDASLSAHDKSVADKQSAAGSAGKYETLAIAGAVAVGAGLAFATRGRSLLASEGTLGLAANSAAKHLPDVLVTGTKVAGGAAERAVLKGAAENAVVVKGAEGALAANPALREQTIAEKVSEKTFHFGIDTAKKVLRLMGRAEEAEAGVVVSDDVRRSVFNRFLSRLDQDRYVLHGSYQLESQQYIARKAVKDVDLLAIDPALVKGSKVETNAAVLDDFKRMLARDKKDGLTFEVSFVDKELIHYFFPRMRHGIAIAKSEGQELMRIPLDIRLGAKTVLPPQEQVLRTAVPGGATQETVVSAMRPEETVAYKLFSYTNRTIGGVNRKAKDLTDVASILQKGVDEQLVVKALEEWTSRGFTMGAMRHPETIMGLGRLEARPELMMGQTREQLDASYRLVRNYYDRVAPKVANTPLRPEVSNGMFARVGRFFEKQSVVYPKE